MSSVLAWLLDPPWIEVFLLRRAGRTVASYPLGRAAVMRRLFQSADLRIRAADGLVRTMPVASLPLYREGALLYMAALCFVRTPAPFEDLFDDDRIVEHFVELARQNPTSVPGDELEDFVRFLTHPDPSWLDRQPRREVERKLGWVRSMVSRLRSSNEPRSLGHIRAQRAARLGGLLALLVGLMVWRARAVIHAENIALNKPVLQSSMHPLAAYRPGGLTDGVISDSYGVHTNREPLPWVQIDLGGVFRIDEIAIYNRNDGWFDDGLPMTLLLSENGQEFFTVDTRRQSFSAASPWTYLAQGRPARYVRVNGAPGTYVALNEIEVSSKK